MCGLLLSQPATATNFLLNGLAISFATTVDNHVAHFCLSPRERDEVDAALALVADGAGSDGTDAAAWADAAKRDPMLASIPLGRFAEVDDVADCVLYLLSDAAAMVNGVCVPVDGGFLAARAHLP